MATTKVSLKLLIDKKRHQVLFAKAGKELIDFLITILALLVGPVNMCWFFVLIFFRKVKIWNIKMQKISI